MYSVSYVEPYDIHVSGVTFKEQENGFLEIRVSVDADISVKGKTRYGYEELSDDRIYNVFFTAKLENGLQQVKITKAEEYNQAKFEKDKSLSQNLVPYMYEEDVERHAEDFLKRHYPKALLQPMAIPADEIVEAYDGISQDALALKWMEWQANQLAPRILMPAEMTKKVYHDALRDIYTANPRRRFGEIMEEAVGHLANFFKCHCWQLKSD